MLAIQSDTAKYHSLHIQDAVAFQTPDPFLTHPIVNNRSQFEGVEKLSSSKQRPGTSSRFDYINRLPLASTAWNFNELATLLTLRNRLKRVAET